jgi:hypothetical protein
MSTWTAEELTTIGNAEELKLASRRSAGTLRPFVTMWVVRAGDDLYVRSAYGPNNSWYRRAKASGAGRIRAAGIERDVGGKGHHQACPALLGRQPPQNYPNRPNALALVHI